jgi:AcrR family transcriptional regulator
MVSPAEAGKAALGKAVRPDTRPAGVAPAALDPRAAVLAAAVRLVAHEGFAAASLRRVASEAGCSTMVVYHHFGSKQGLFDALFVQGFTVLSSIQEAAANTGEPVERIRNIGMALRQMAIAHADSYRVIFAQSAPPFVPSHEVRGVARQNYQRFLDAVQAWSAQTPLVTDPMTAAHILWTSGHGLIMTELAGNIPHVDPAAAYRIALDALINGLRAAGQPQ